MELGVRGAETETGEGSGPCCGPGRAVSCLVPRSCGRART